MIRDSCFNVRGLAAFAGLGDNVAVVAAEGSPKYHDKENEAEEE